MSAVLIFDTETSDKEPGREVIEAAWLKVQPRTDLLGDLDYDSIALPFTCSNAFQQRYKPTKPCTFGSMAVHHILPEELENMPPASEFQLPANVAYICGHKIDFDWETIGKPNVKRICTLAMSQNIWPTTDSHSQSALLYMLEGPTVRTRSMLRDAHSAVADAANNLVLLEHILAAKPEIRTWSALWAFSEEARCPTVMFMGRNKGVPLSQLESGEIEWYLARDFIDEYQRKALNRELQSRRSAYATNEDEEEDDDDIHF